MKIAVIGATGDAGSRIVTELLSRGHQVSASLAIPISCSLGPGLTLVQGDVKDEAGMRKLLDGSGCGHPQHEIPRYRCKYRDRSG